MVEVCNGEDIALVSGEEDSKKREENALWAGSVSKSRTRTVGTRVHGFR